MASHTMDSTQPRLSLDLIQPLPGNVKLHNLPAIIASIEKHGFADPIGINEATGHDYDGNGRADALRLMRAEGKPAPRYIVEETGPDGGRVWLVPVFYIDEPDAGLEAELALKLNKLNEAGGYDEQALYEMICARREDNPDILTEVGIADKWFENMQSLQAPADVEFKEFTEAVADDVKYQECPSCGHKWPK